MLLNLLSGERGSRPTEQGLIFGAFAKGGILRTQSRRIISVLVNRNSLGNMSINSCSLDKAERN